MINDFLKAIFDGDPHRVIRAEFDDGKTVDYTSSIYHLLVTDKHVKHIIDAETGELLYSR